jgi:hypothetical protein
MVRDLGIKSDPNMHRAHKRPTQSADRSTERRLASGETSEKTGRENEINLGSVDCNTESKDDWVTHCCMSSSQKQTHQLRDEAQLNCVALRPSLDYAKAWRPVKGQDERQKPAPLTALHATWEVAATSEKKIRRAATSAP